MTESFTLTSLFRGLIGMAFILGLAFLLCRHKKSVNWRTVVFGLILQVSLAILILKVPLASQFFEIIGKCFVAVLEWTKAGSVFLFGGIMDSDHLGFIFAFQILPTIIFFAALTSLFYYFGIIQVVVRGLAWLLTKALYVSGAESLAVAGNIFLGQTESPLMIKAYLPRMNRSEILLVMSAGMATLAGGVLAAYIGFLGGEDHEARLMFARHLLSASIMAAPGVIVISKLVLPQTEPIEDNVEVDKTKIGKNPLDAISNGTTEGLKLAANVAAMLLVFTAFIFGFNYIFRKIGEINIYYLLIAFTVSALFFVFYYLKRKKRSLLAGAGIFAALTAVALIMVFGTSYYNLNQWITAATNGSFTHPSLQFLLGYAFAPLMWLLGVQSSDIVNVGQVLGQKIILTEFIGYTSLAELKNAGMLSPKSIIMATYMLSGFANFASIGIQIGGIGTLAPNRRQMISELGIKALITGTLASLLSATIVGILIGG